MQEIEIELRKAKNKLHRSQLYRQVKIAARNLEAEKNKTQSLREKLLDARRVIKVLKSKLKYRGK